ncbi:hypothetical protein J6590_009182 [Homalodisca vitripennis]|nr:hypothetical protein J6590_009182 [Homalodisca vitripennis]
MRATGTDYCSRTYYPQTPSLVRFVSSIDSYVNLKCGLLVLTTARARTTRKLLHSSASSIDSYVNLKRGLLVLTTARARTTRKLLHSSASSVVSTLTSILNVGYWY